MALTASVLINGEHCTHKLNNPARQEHWMISFWYIYWQTVATFQLYFTEGKGRQTCTKWAYEDKDLWSNEAVLSYGTFEEKVFLLSSGNTLLTMIYTDERNTHYLFGDDTRLIVLQALQSGLWQYSLNSSKDSLVTLSFSSRYSSCVRNLIFSGKKRYLPLRNYTLMKVRVLHNSLKKL